jgi:hypothetical protein
VPAGEAIEPLDGGMQQLGVGLDARRGCPSALDSELLGPLFATLTTRDDLETKPRLAAPGLRAEYVASDQWVRWWRNIWMRRLGKSLDVLPGLVAGSDRPSITRRVAVLLPKSLVGCIIFGLGPRVQGNRHGGRPSSRSPL